MPLFYPSCGTGARWLGASFSMIACQTIQLSKYART